MSVVGSQQQIVLRLLRALQPDWRRDPALPARIQRLFSLHKGFGSRDRRLYRELLYTALRYLPWIERRLDAEPDRAVKIIAWLAADTRATAAFRQETCGDWPAPGTLAERAAFLGEDSAALLPDWFRAENGRLFESPELDVQLARAPLWLRLQTEDPKAVASEFETRGWRVQSSEILPSAWRLLDEADVTKSDAYARGAVEVQDLGSQLVLAAAGVVSGGHWLDACAGAGGKTLQLARLVGPSGRVDAHDIRPAALEELSARARRARIANVRIVRAPTADGYDGVLVDAPCSGSGTWRRAPHLKWCTTPATLRDRAALQQTILRRFASAVKPGGRLIYATCSLARSENEDVIADFLAENPRFSMAPLAATFGFEAAARGLTIYPARHDTDGFFVAMMRKADASVEEASV